MADCSDDVNEFSVSIKGLEFLDVENHCVLLTNSIVWNILLVLTALSCCFCVSAF